MYLFLVSLFCHLFGLCVELSSISVAILCVHLLAFACLLVVVIGFVHLRFCAISLLRYLFVFICVAFFYLLYWYLILVCFIEFSVAAVIGVLRFILMFSCHCLCYGILYMCCFLVVLLLQLVLLIARFSVLCCAPPCSLIYCDVFSSLCVVRSRVAVMRLLARIVLALLLFV